MSQVNIILTAMKENREYRQCDIAAMTKLDSSSVSRIMKMLVDGELVEQIYRNGEIYKKKKVKRYKSKPKELRI